MSKRKIRMALLEDTPELRHLFEMLLTRRGHEVFCYDSPVICPLQQSPACRCAASERCVDIILSDIRMPTINGLDFVENQKKKQCKAPYIAMMSGSWTSDDLKRAERLGCKILQKPFEASEINEWLDEVEANIDLEHQLRDWVTEPICEKQADN
jgi:CheY-like chemotaxis protein